MLLTQIQSAAYLKRTIRQLDYRITDGVMESYHSGLRIKVPGVKKPIDIRVGTTTVRISIPLCIAVYRYDGPRKFFCSNIRLFVPGCVTTSISGRTQYGCAISQHKRTDRAQLLFIARIAVATLAGLKV